MSGGLRCADNIVAVPNLGQDVSAQGAKGQPLKWLSPSVAKESYYEPPIN